MLKRSHPYQIQGSKEKKRFFLLLSGPAETDKMPEHPGARHRVEMGITAERGIHDRTIETVPDTDAPGELVGEAGIGTELDRGVMELMPAE